MAEPGDKRRAYRPLIGFVLAVVVGVIAWVIAPSVIGWLANVLPVFQGNELPLATTRPIFTVLIVLLTLILFALVAALTAPKDQKATSAAGLERDRDALHKREKAERDAARRSKGRH